MSYVNGTSHGDTVKASVKAAAWRLEVPESNSLRAESTIVPDDGSEGHESIIGLDKRELVDKQDFQDGGRYRSIVKIQSCFKDTKSGTYVWMMGTGWLVRPDLLVTAGHVVFDWGRDYGATIRIKCYIGYDGRDSVGSTNVQARYGKDVITTSSWVQDPVRLRDVAFIKLHKPFEGNLNLFSYVKTPEIDTAMITIVGYPGDKSQGAETGAQMYEMSKTIEYNIDESKRHMIEYDISSFGGQSGAPILRRQNGVTKSIGTHCYGGGGKEKNSGNSIGNQWGNKYDDFIYLLSHGKTEFGTPANINFTEVKDSDSNDDDEEGFFDVLKKVAKVGSGLLPLAGSMLGGPVGGAVGTVAGGLLGAVTEAATTGTDNSPSETGLVRSGVKERAMLAEACLQTVLSLPQSSESMAVLKDMEKIWTDNAPDVAGLARLFTPQLTDSALTNALDRLRKVKDPSYIDHQESSMERRPLETGSSESFPSQNTAFVEGLFAPTRPETDEEGAFSWLGPALSKAVTLAKPLVSKAAKAAIEKFGPKLIDKVIGGIGGGSESILALPGVESREAEVHILLQRALLADTTLQALMALPKSRLDKLLTSAEGSDKSEGFFDAIKSVVQKFGPTVASVGGDAIIAFAPAIIKAVTDRLSESSLSPSTIPIHGGTGTGKGPRKQRSILDLLEGDQVSQFSSKDIQQPMAKKSDIPDVIQPLGQSDGSWLSLDQISRNNDDNGDCMPIMIIPPKDFSA
ncbi:hypothetical protein MBLNU459_g0133t1 [Dothideomycetes sp. NU459]